MSKAIKSSLNNLSHQFSTLGHSLTNGRIGEPNDSKLFTSSKKGELAELKVELQQPSKERQKAAVKRVIAAMTIGQDMSSLFPEVVNCMQTTNIELKKLVYLYVITFARMKPELAIMVVNTFRKDALDPSPLVRALSIRTMSSIRLPQIVEYLVEPLKRACRDQDPYVRKTAAIAIGKLYETSSQAAIEFDFLTILRNELMHDANPMVISNAIATLTEISILSEKDRLNFTHDSASRLISSLSDCSEWGQVAILDALSQFYEPKSPKEAIDQADKLVARLNHANPAVVLSTVKLLLIFIECISSGNRMDAAENLIKRCSPPLLSLLTSTECPELQLVVLRNLQIIQLKCPRMLGDECRAFFVKFSDPSYVKFEKLELLTRCVSPSNFDLILTELKEYCGEVDLEFSRRAIRSIGRVLLQSPDPNKCYDVLLEVLQARQIHAVEEVVVVLRDIIRSNAGQKLTTAIEIIRPLIPMISSPPAKSATIWLCGEFPQFIPEAQIILKSYLQSFLDESTEVQLQLLTASLKLFVNAPSAESKAIVHQVLTIASKESEDPDLRDRGLLYWRLLSFSPKVAKEVVQVERPAIAAMISKPFTDELLEVLVRNIGMLASVHHEDPKIFIGKVKESHSLNDEVAQSSSDDEEKRLGGGGILSLEETNESEDHKISEESEDEEEVEEEEDDDTESDENQMPPPRVRPVPPKLQLFQNDAILIEGCATRRNDCPAILLRMHNMDRMGRVITSLRFEINSNIFGLSVANNDAISQISIPPSSHKDVMVVMHSPNGMKMNSEGSSSHLNVMMSHSLSPSRVQFNVPIDVSIIFIRASPPSKERFTSLWAQMETESNGMTFVGSREHPRSSENSIDSFISLVDCYNLAVAGSRELPASYKLFCAVVISDSAKFLIQMDIQKNGAGLRLMVRSKANKLIPLVGESIFGILGGTIINNNVTTNAH